MKKIFERVAEINARLRAIADAMESEKRDMTDAEKAEVASLERERTFLTMRMQSSLPAPGAPEKTKAQKMREGLQTIVSGGQVMELQFRAEGAVPSNTSNPHLTEDIKNTGLFPISVQDVLYPLEEELIYKQIGIQMPTGCRGSYEWPVVEALNAEIAGENVELTEQKINLDKVATVTQRIGITTSATREALFNSDGKLEGIIRTLMPKAIADVMNTILISPTKVTADCAITGPFVGKTAKAVQLSFKALNKEKAALLAKGVKSSSLVWVMTEATKAELEATPKDAGSGIRCIEDGRLCGLPVFCHNAIGEGNIGLGAFNYQVAGQFGDVYFIVDPYTGAGSNKVKFTINVDFGTATLRPEAFALYKVTA